MLRGRPYGADISFKAFLHPNLYTVRVGPGSEYGGFIVISVDVGVVNTFLKALNTDEKCFPNDFRLIEVI